MMMNRNTKIAALFCLFSILFLIVVGAFADKKFEQSGQSIKLGVEFRSDQVEQLKRDNEKIIEELTATNNDLVKASVLNYNIQKQADSAIRSKDQIIQNQLFKNKKKDETIDSLIAIIEQYRQSDI